MKKILIGAVLLVAALFSYEDDEYEEMVDVQVTPVRTTHIKTIDLKFLDFSKLSKKDQREVRCLALNMYREARGESRTGLSAVAFVTFNRVKSSTFPNSVCGVVYQRNSRGCQFSWVCDRKHKKLDEKTFKQIKNMATFIYINKNSLKDPTHGALFYHAHYVNPFWNRVMKKTTVIDNHIFYTHRR